MRLTFRQLALRALLIWGAFGLFESLQAYAMQPSRGMERSLVLAFARNMPYWLVWALLTPVVAWLVSRFPLQRGRLVQRAALHVGASVLVALTHLVVAAYVLFPFAPVGAPVGSWQTMAWNFFGNYMAVELVTYWGMLAVFHALSYYRTLADREVETARLAARTAQLERAVSNARLDALRMELNPHFLFNTLNSVSGLVRTGDRDGAVDMLAQLGDLLRTTLGAAHTPVVTLDEEIGYLSRFLAIEAVRFRDRLSVAYDIDPQARDGEVPTLILQPLVENAVRHGIARDPGGGRIEIGASIDDDILCLRVRNVTSAEAPRATTAREGVGLSNTRRRLAEMYGTDASLSTQVLPDGFASIIRLPFVPTNEVVHA